MPGLHIDEVGGGDGSTGAIITTIEVPLYELPENTATPVAVLNWLNNYGVSKLDPDTVRVIVGSDLPINPSIIASEQFIETEVVELRLVNSQGDPQIGIKDFRMDGETSYYQNALISKGQWKEGSSEDLIHFPVDWQALYREFSAYYKLEDSRGVETWYYVIPQLEVVDGKLVIAFDIDYNSGVQGDARACNIDYLFENPNAVLKLIKAVDNVGNPVKIVGLGFMDENYNRIPCDYSWGYNESEQYVYLPADVKVYVTGANTFQPPRTYVGHMTQYQYNSKDPIGSAVLMDQYAIEIEIYNL